MSEYVRDLLERMVSSAAGAALAAIGADAVNLLQVDYRQVVGLAAGAAVVSLLKGLAARRVGDHESAALLASPEKGTSEN